MLTIMDSHEPTPTPHVNIYRLSACGLEKATEVDFFKIQTPLNSANYLTNFLESQTSISHHAAMLHYCIYDTYWPWYVGMCSPAK